MLCGHIKTLLLYCRVVSNVIHFEEKKKQLKTAHIFKPMSVIVCLALIGV